MTRIKRPAAAVGAAALLAFSLTACGGAPDDASEGDFCDAFKWRLRDLFAVDRRRADRGPVGGLPGRRRRAGGGRHSRGHLRQGAQRLRGLRRGGRLTPTTTTSRTSPARSPVWTTTTRRTARSSSPTATKTCPDALGIPTDLPSDPDRSPDRPSDLPTDLSDLTEIPTPATTRGRPSLTKGSPHEAIQTPGHRSGLCCRLPRLLPQRLRSAPGDDDGPPTDASEDEFCEVINDPKYFEGLDENSDEQDYVDAVQDLADDIKDVGTPDEHLRRRPRGLRDPARRRRRPGGRRHRPRAAARTRSGPTSTMTRSRRSRPTSAYEDETCGNEHRHRHARGRRPEQTST